MSLLSDRDLKESLGNGDLDIIPYDSSLIQPASIDIRLSQHFRVFVNHNYTHIDPSIEQELLTDDVAIPTGLPFILHPGEFVLGSTMEWFKFGKNLAGRVEGKSSLGRLGLLVHSTAGFVDPGFEGTLTIELSNVANLPIKLWWGMRIGQLCVFELKSPAEFPYGHESYGSRYFRQLGPTPSRSHLNWKDSRQ